MDPQAEIGQVGPGERDRSRRPHALDRGCVDRSDGLGEGSDSLCRWPSGDVDVLLHAARHAVQRTEHVAPRHGRVCLVGGGPRLVGEQPHDGVHGAVALLDPGDVGIEDFPTRYLSSADLSGQFDRSQLPQLRHGPIMAHT